MNIGVFCSARDLGPEYTEPVIDFAKHIGEHKHTLIWGGSDTGLMHLVADGVQQAGGKIVGVTIAHYAANLDKKADEMVMAKDLFDRKRIMIERSDAFVILVGGIGTLDEVTDAMELKREHMHDLPIVMLNTNNFYEPLREQLKVMERGGFLDYPLTDLVDFADNSHAALDIIVAKTGLDKHA